MHVYALLLEGSTGQREEESRRYGDAMVEAVPLAAAHGHEPNVGLRDADEVLCRCGRCSALGFVDAASRLIGGELFEDDCPHETPPMETALTLFYCSP